MTLLLPSADYFDDYPGLQYYPPGDSMAPNDVRQLITSEPQRRRQVQFDIQKSNIYASQLATRSYYVEMYLNLRDVAKDNKGQRVPKVEMKPSAGNGIFFPGAIAAPSEQDDLAADNYMMAERELIVQHLLVVLTSIPQRNMEPNGSSLINKIRQVASTLYNDAPERRGPLAARAQEHLGRFIEIMMRLEKTGGG